MGNPPKEYLRPSSLQTPSQPLELFPSKLKVFGGQEVSSSQASLEDGFRATALNTLIAPNLVF